MRSERRSTGFHWYWLVGRIAYVELQGCGLSDVKGRWDRLWLRRRIPPALPRQNRRGEPALAPRLGSYVRGARSPAARPHDRRRDDPPILDDARRLPRADLEWRRDGPGLRHRRIHREAVSRPARQHVHGARAAALERERRQARGADAQGLHRRHWPSPRFARPSGRAGLEAHPKVGASIEGFALQEVGRALRARPEQCFFWATHQGAELDMLVVRQGRRRGFEFKRSDAPAVTKSMHIAIQDLGLESIDVVHAGRDTYPLSPKIRALAISRLTTELGRARRPRRSLHLYRQRARQRSRP